jgi:hypothetical protein
VTKLKKKYLWSWAIAGATIPLLLLLAGLLIPKPPAWTGVVAELLWPTEFVAEVLALVVTDAGGDANTTLASATIIAISLLLNAAIYVGIGLILWTFGEVFSRLSQRRSPN